MHEFIFAHFWQSYVEVCSLTKLNHLVSVFYHYHYHCHSLFVNFVNQ